MRAGFLTSGLIIALAVGGCRSSTLGAADASPDAALLCAHAPGVDCAVGSTFAAFCSLNMGIQRACSPCGPPDAGQPCNQVVLVHGTKYTYLESLGVDTATIYVYEANDSLIAELGWSPGGWTCVGGLAHFDASEAQSVFPFVSSVDQHTMCPIDGGSAS
jgi:hypothetical protein